MENLKELAALLGISEEVLIKNQKLLGKATKEICSQVKETAEESKTENICKFVTVAETVTDFLYQEMSKINPLPGGQMTIHFLVKPNGELSCWSKAKPKDLQTPTWNSPLHGSTTETPADFKRGYNKSNNS